VLIIGFVGRDKDDAGEKEIACMARRLPSKAASESRVGAMFPEERLRRLNASPTVRSMTPKDLGDLRRAFSFHPEKVGNKKVQSLTTDDLHAVESLFRDYRMAVVATFRGVFEIDTSGLGLKPMTAGCCCSSSCCTQSPRDIDPNPF
jgi:hypothetical protein